ncbi:MAG: histidine--tRNA ligase [Actinomycetota bacterium]
MANDPSLSAPRGTRDLLPPESWAWQRVIRVGMDMFAAAGYAPADTPVFEHTEVFERGVGETTEVVGKQMYTFIDRGDRSLTLRPEGTAPVMRAVLEHSLHRAALPVKLAYFGPMFRQERPQKGRYRQFWQIGIEAIGSESPLADVEVIELAMRFYRTIGLEVKLQLNTIGHAADDCRLRYSEVLAAYLREHQAELAGIDRERIRANPLRTFDSKETPTVEVMAGAPLITDHVCDECRSHHAEVIAGLDALGVEFESAPRLVRGLDYYMRTAFEFVAGGLGSQNAAGGGGRYDGLAELLGGPRVPGIGFALGLDRIMLSLAEQESGPQEGFVTAYVTTLGEAQGTAALEIATRLRRAGISADLDLMGRGMKGQMKAAARSGARFTVILGADEAGPGHFLVKDMTTGEQTTVDDQELERRLTR